MQHVFVYGSLKRGFANHGHLSKEAFISKAYVKGFELYSLGSFPAAVSGEGVCHGEVYEVSEETLKTLDHLEGHPHLYKRTGVPVYVENMNAFLPCLMYVYQHYTYAHNLIETGEWTHEHVCQQASPLRDQSKKAV